MSHHDKVEFLGSGKITIPGPNKVTILGPDNVTILRKFLPYLRLIRALNLENFHRNRDGLQNFLPTFYAIAMIGSMSIGTILMICNLFESDGDTKVFVVSIPMLMSLILVHVLFVALIWKNETTAEAIKRMQKLVSYRKKIFLGVQVENLFKSINLNKNFSFHKKKKFRYFSPVRFKRVTAITSDL